MDLSTATPVEIDTVLADLYEQYWAKSAEITRYATYRRESQDLLAKVDAGTYRYHFNEQYDRPKHEGYIAEHTAKIAALEAEQTVLDEQAAPYEAEYARRRWSRFFQVQDGHIHSSMSCSTCNKMGKPTRFGWIPERSGQTEEQALESLVTESRKTILCTVCYPHAPVAWTVVREDPDTCPGSGTFDYPRETARQGYYSGNYGVCSHCSNRVTTTSTGKMRKHKA
jgi:hypothetical protein